MKKIILIFSLCFLAYISVDAQKSAVKLGLGGLFVTAANLRFETAVGERTSFQITGSYKLPSKFADTNQESYSFSGGKLKGFAVIPEFRFYFGQDKAGTIEGFYLAPYLKFHKYGINSASTYNYTNPQGVETLLSPELNLNLTTFGAGLQLGYHWIFGEHFSLDWHFLGLGGDVHRLGFKADFKNSDVDLLDVTQSIIDEYNDNNPDDRIPFSTEDLDRVIDGKQVRLSTPLAFVGFRAGLSIGYAF